MTYGALTKEIHPNAVEFVIAVKSTESMNIDEFGRRIYFPEASLGSSELVVQFGSLTRAIIQYMHNFQ